MCGDPGRFEPRLSNDIVEVHRPDNSAVGSDNCVSLEPVDLLEENVEAGGIILALIVAEIHQAIPGDIRGPVSRTCLPIPCARYAIRIHAHGFPSEPVAVEVIKEGIFRAGSGNVDEWIPEAELEYFFADRPGRAKDGFGVGHPTPRFEKRQDRRPCRLLRLSR